VPVALVVCAYSAVSAQSRVRGRSQKLPDFDIRETSPAPDVPIVAQRLSRLTTFQRDADQARLGTRIVPNKYGVPKLYLREGRSLTGPSQLPATEIVKSFLRSQTDIFQLSNNEIDGLRLLMDDSTDTARFVALNQTVSGIDVFNGQIKFTLNKAGEIIQVATGDVVPGLSVSSTPRLRADEAVNAVFASIGSRAGALTTIPGADGKTSFANPRGGRYSAITSELVVFPTSASSARLAYRVSLEFNNESWYEVLVDAESGALLFRHNLYVSLAGQGRVWPESPSVGMRSLVNFPDGWLSANPTVTTGNNVDAYLDADGNDKPDSVTNATMQNGRALGTGGVFDFPFGDGTSQQDPRLFPEAAVTNLFYFINAAHDFYYKLGFTETSGNFQANNFGLGGVGNDAVLAEAQYGGFTDDAAFSPTAEGVAPKIRVGIFTRNTVTLTDDLDADYDGTVMVHEYTHGVSNRLVGAKTSTTCLAKIQSGALGEGWSDYFSASFFNDPVIGAYITQNSVSGIRRYSYDNYPLTYEDIGNGTHGYEVHDDGEIWAGTLWDLRKSLGAAKTDQLVLDGLRSTPCNPSMTDARDAILTADQADNNSANRKTIWTIFAKHGIGYSAVGVDGTLLTGTQYNAAYDLPPDLQSSGNPKITSNPLSIRTGNGDLYKYSVTASNPLNGTLNYALTVGPSGMTVDPSSGLVVWTATFVTQRVKITVTDGRGGKVVHGYALPILTQLSAGVSTSIAASLGTFGVAQITVPANTQILQVTLRGGNTDGDADLYVIGADGILSISANDGSNETLSFPNPKPGTWFVEADAYMSFTGVSLTASFITPTVLSPNTTLTNLGAIFSSETFYKWTVPAGASSFSVSTTGGTGDVDIFLKKGSPPTCQETAVVAPCVYDEVSANVGNQESITINSPAAADAYLNMTAYDTYAGVTLNIVTTFPPLTVSSGGVVRTTTTDTGTSTSTGYATTTVANGSVPFATAVFSLTQNGIVVSEAGVPASPPTQSARIFIDYRTGVASGVGTLNIDTGLAMANPGTTAASLTFTLRDKNGQTITTGHGTLAAGAHRATFVDQLNTIAPDFNLPATFSTSTLYGSLEVASTQPVSLLALRLTANQRGDTLLTSTPVADLSKAQTTSTVYFPQLADGGGFTTSILLLNTSTATETGTIALSADDGTALTVRPVGGQAGSSFPYSIPASGFFVFQTDGTSSSTQVGSVRVTPGAGSNAPAGAGIFSYSPQGILVTESGIPSAQPTTKARIYVDKSGGHDTGIALANPGGSAASVTVAAYQTDGATSAGNTAAPLNINPAGHKAAFAGEMVTGLPSNFTGVVEITSPSPFVALTLRALTNSRGDVLLTTFPVADETQTAPSPIIFPQIADGNGFSTQFIFISASGAASVNLNFTGDDGSPLTFGRIP
jgi:Zn-dependent metalloprotease